MADILPRLPANEGVAVSRLHLEHAVADSENGDIERGPEGAREHRTSEALRRRRKD